jgi:hypothetical protein
MEFVLAVVFCPYKAAGCASYLNIIGRIAVASFQQGNRSDPLCFTIGFEGCPVFDS